MKKGIGSRPQHYRFTLVAPPEPHTVHYPLPMVLYFAVIMPQLAGRYILTGRISPEEE